MNEEEIDPTDLAPDADELGDECPEDVKILTTSTDQVVPDEIDQPDPPNQVTGDAA